MNRTLDETDEDVELPLRTSDRRTAPRDDFQERAADHELTLSTGTVLGLFFVLALICAVFFGFGYTMGRKSATGAGASADTASTSAETPAPIQDGPSKPAAGSPAIQAIPGYLSQKDADAANASSATQGYKAAPVVTNTAGGGTTVAIPLGAGKPKPESTPATANAPARKSADEIMAETKPFPVAKPIVITPAMAPPPPTVAEGTHLYNGAVAAAPANGPIYVQVSAMSHKEDADNLVAALKRQGFPAVERSVDTDKLIHVQVGPFPTRPQAEAMRVRLQADSYNAILK